MLCQLALLSALLASSLAQDPTLLARFTNFTRLNAAPLYELYWNVTGNRIAFAVRVQTNGWVGFGISPLGLMLDSDVVMGFVDDTTGVTNFYVSGFCYLVVNIDVKFASSDYLSIHCYICVYNVFVTILSIMLILCW